MDFFEFESAKYSSYKVSRKNKEIIEPEEIFMDASVLNSAQGESVIEDAKLETAISPRVFWLLFFTAIALFSVLFFRSAYLDVIKGQFYSNLALRNSSRIYPVSAPRGTIYDRNLKPVVKNNPSFNVLLLSSLFPKEKEERDLIVSNLSEIISLPKSEIENFISANRFSADPIIIAENIDYKKALELEAKRILGVYVETFPARTYLEPYSMSHLLGYTGLVTKKDLNKNDNLFFNDYIGKDGIEFFYDKYLRGKNGEVKVDVDSKGAVQKVSQVSPSFSGNNAILTIDASLQKVLYEKLSQSIKSYGGTGGAAIAADPRSGEILALVSAPSYDNNIFTSSRNNSAIGSVLNLSSKPLFNRAISGVYPSGSTIKPFIAIAALEENIISPTRKIIDEGGAIYIKNPYNPEIVYKFSDWKDHGWTDMVKAIAESVNTYFYAVGGGYGDIKGLGIYKIAE